MNKPSEITMLVHGGSGRIRKTAMDPQKEKEYSEALEKAVTTGYTVMEKGGNCLEAVEASIKILENTPLFNAGRGAVFSNDEIIELDASIMEGKTLKAGSVAGVRNIKNPISAAKMVLEKSPHVFLCGRGAEEFALLNGLEIADLSYFKTEERWLQIKELKQEEPPGPDNKGKGMNTVKWGTVGAVALDHSGNLAAGTSTGGMLNKRYGRIGDSPIIGAGTYANKWCAVSCTGHGEFFIRFAVAHDMAALMEYKGLSVEEAAHEVIFNKVTPAGGVGGIISLDAKGNMAMPHSTEGMFWAYGSEKKGLKINVCNMVIE